MIPLIEQHRDKLQSLCQQHHVAKLELFGSALDPVQFDDSRSDLDFLVEFSPLPPGEYAESYFGLLENLRELFQRPVDLVVSRAIRNPYFLQEVNRTRTVLYAA